MVVSLLREMKDRAPARKVHRIAPITLSLIAVPSVSFPPCRFTDWIDRVLVACVAGGCNPRSGVQHAGQGNLFPAGIPIRASKRREEIIMFFLVHERVLLLTL
jgi:hypothetical protein